MRKLLGHSLVAAMAASSCFAVADDVDEVIITAFLFSKNADAANHPVNVLSGSGLQQAAAATLGETLNGQLGVNSASFGPGVGLPVIRGQSDNRVKVMQDSVGSMDASSASPDHAVTLEPLLATRIEVLRGPAALRYGSGAIGGVVNVVDNRIPTALPEKGFSGGAELRGNSANDETNGVVNLNTAIDRFAFHLDAISREGGNLRIPGSARKSGTETGVSTDALGAQGILDNTDAQYHAGTLGGSYIGEQGFVGMSINHLDNNYGVPPDSEERVRIDMHQTRYDLKGELSDPFQGVEKISAHLGHANYQHTEMEDGVAGTRFTNNAYEGRLELMHDPIELFDRNLRGALGLQVSHSLFAAIGEEAFIPKSDINNSGLFVVEEIDLGKLTMELGARADSQQIRPEGGETIRHASVNLSATNTWHFTEHQQLSLGIAQSQRAPSVEELLADGPHPATGSYLLGDSQLHEETSNNLELGYRVEAGRVDASLNLFYNHFNDFIYSKNNNQIIDDLQGYQYTQADATFRGAEAEVKIALGSRAQWRVFSDYVRATLDAGGDLPRINPWRYGTEFNYKQHQWNGNLTVTHTTQQRHAGEFESETAAYTRVDARLDYSMEKNNINYVFFLKGTNLLDAEIRNASSYLRDIAPEAGRGLQAGVRVTF